VDTFEIALRLGIAMLIGAAIGLNRDLHGKPTGVRTLGLVALGAAVAVLSIRRSSPADASRVVQGIVTGIGFIGAGVIIRNRTSHIHGLTTAACAWTTGCIGAACGIADWRIILIAVPLVFVILMFGGPLEHAVRRRWPGHAPHVDDK
jgi:putative Mg2+ transporter-C (MgtC) family protein